MAAAREDLIRDARNGNVDAFGQLLDSYKGYLTVLAQIQIGRRLRGKADPADVVQDAFMDAHRQFPTFRGVSVPEFGAWLRRILAGQLALLIRRHMSAGRDMRLEQELEVQLDQSSAVLDRGLVGTLSTPSQHAARREQASILAEALASIQADYRDVLILRHVEGFAFPEIALRLGRTENAVQKLWARAIAAIRRQLEDER